MSDNEGQTKKSGYRLEYASSGRAKCKGTKPCAGTPIPKGELRMGSIVDFRGNTSYVWRHWGCVTPKIITNMKNQFENADDLDGFEDLNDEDKERIRLAWQEGKVADEDIPETARKPAGEEGEERPKKRAPAKKKVEAEEGEEEKPKRKRVTKAKKVDEEGAEDEDEPSEEKAAKAPAKKSRAKKPAAEGEEGVKKKAAPRKQPAKPRKKVAKEESEAEVSGEDFAEEMAGVEDDEEEEEDTSSKKRKRPASSRQTAPTKKPKAASSRTKKSKAVVEEEDDLDEE